MTYRAKSQDWLRGGEERVANDTRSNDNKSDSDTHLVAEAGTQGCRTPLL